MKNNVLTIKKNRLDQIKTMLSNYVKKYGRDKAQAVLKKIHKHKYFSALETIQEINVEMKIQCPETFRQMDIYNVIVDKYAAFE